MKLEKAFISFRIGTPQWLSRERFDDLTALFEKNRGMTDEITFFTSETHAPLPLIEMQRRVDILTERMKTVRRLGYRTGINILATIGHHEENLPYSLQGNYTHLTDINGNVSQGTYCPNDAGFCAEYVKPLYEMIANAGPDYIWVDDDVRLRGHKPIVNTCFCDNCLKLFGQETGKSIGSREELKKAFSQGAVEKRIEMRKAWLRHNSRTIGNLLELIEQTVHSINPRMPIGFMDGGRFYEGYDLKGWADRLAGPDGVEVFWRPGGGNYTEEHPDDVFSKAHILGREAASLPESIVCIESELESFNYQRLKKSGHYTLLEAACYIAAGCTGTAFNVLSMYDEPLDEYEPLLEQIAAGRPFLDLMVKTLSGESPSGIHTGWNRDVFAARNLNGDWFSEASVIPGLGHTEEMLKIGLPAAYRADRASVVALSGDSVVVMSDDDIRKTLGGGVYLDGEALARINRRGYQELTGFAVSGIKETDQIEQLVQHPLNSGFAGRYRDGRQSFWPRAAYSFTPTGQTAEILARQIDYGHQEIAECSMGIFENSLGGRICVAGYYPWEQLQSMFKTTKIKRVMRWLSKDSISAYVESYHRISLWDRTFDDGRHGIVLVNCCLDTAKNVELLLKTRAERVRVTDMYLRDSEISTLAIDGSYRKVVIPSMQPWLVCLINTI